MPLSESREDLGSYIVDPEVSGRIRKFLEGSSKNFVTEGSNDSSNKPADRFRNFFLALESDVPYHSFKKIEDIVLRSVPHPLNGDSAREFLIDSIAQLQENGFPIHSDYRNMDSFDLYTYFTAVRSIARQKLPPR